mgnify:CR=1 FL=1
MSNAIQRRGGTTAQHASFTGLAREITIDTDKKVVVVHDGGTPGGFPMAPAKSPIFTGLSSIEGLLEKISVSATAATGTINFDALTQALLYYTSNASANWTLNVRGSSAATLNSLMAIGQSMSLAFLVTNGSTAYYQSGFQIDGSPITVKWQGGSAPSSGNNNAIDAYNFVIIKTANATFSVLGSITKFA